MALLDIPHLTYPGMDKAYIAYAEQHGKEFAKIDAAYPEQRPKGCVSTSEAFWLCFGGMPTVVHFRMIFPHVTDHTRILGSAPNPQTYRWLTWVHVRD